MEIDWAPKNAAANRRKHGVTFREAASWSDEPINLKLWKRVPGNPFADYDPADGIALWSLWEMPSCAVGKLVRRGRPRGEPTMTRSVRLPVKTWKRLEEQANAAATTINALIAKRIG